MNFFQSHDRRFDRPPIVAPNLTLVTKECKSNKDIHINSNNIQIYDEVADTFNHLGFYIVAIPLTRL